MINVVVNILLIPVLIIGVQNFTSYVVMAAGLYFFSQKYYKIKYEFGKVFKILATIVITCIIYYYIYYEVGLTLLYKFILFLFYWLVVSYAGC